MTQGKLAESVAESIPGYDPEKHGIAAAVVTKTSDTTIARMIAEMDAAIGGHDIEFSNSLLYEGAADTEGGYATAIDYTALLRKIDTFAREFEKKK